MSEPYYPPPIRLAYTLFEGFHARRAAGQTLDDGERWLYDCSMQQLGAFLTTFVPPNVRIAGGDCCCGECGDSS